MRVRIGVRGSVLAGLVCIGGCWHRPHDTHPREVHPAARPGTGSTTHLDTNGTGGQVWGRVGDVTLASTDGSMLTFATIQDLNAHRPLRGAVLDVSVAGGPSGETHRDPIGWWRPAWIEATGAVHPLIAHDVATIVCDTGAAGVRVTGVVDRVSLEQTICARYSGGFTATTRAVTGLPAGAGVGDEIEAGAAQFAVDHAGTHWQGATIDTGFVLLGDAGIAVAIEAPHMRVRRNDAASHDDITRQIVQVQYTAGPGPAIRTVRVMAGDLVDAIGHLATASRSVALHGAPGEGEFDLLDPHGQALLTGTLPASGLRTLRLPPQLGALVLFRDDRGVPATASVPIPPNGGEIVAPPIPRSSVGLRFTDGQHAALPVHVLFRGLETTRDPEPRMLGRGYHAGRSVYLLEGVGEVALSPGRYRITASHGPRFTLVTQDVTLEADGHLDVVGELDEVVPATGYIAGDFHLHAAPSPDSRVSLAERVGSLFCEGVDFAVATDHNHVTDYGSALAALQPGEALSAIPGEEVTTFAPQWGHFIAYPMQPGLPRSSAIVPFYNTTPGEIFAGARARGAQVIQVNHPRLTPAMGYFDFTHFDPATGHADATFATDFNAVEAFNGWNIENPTRVRQGVVDLVGLVRRGMHPTATGNSDSHYLLFEEAGYPRTYVATARDPFATRADRVVDAMLHGHTTVSAGPFVEMDVSGRQPGDTVQPGANHSVTVHIRVQAPAWVPVENVEFWVDDHVARQFPVTAAPTNGVRFEQTFEVPVDHDVVMVTWVDAHTPLPDVLPYAHAIGVGFTGLVYVDADGDGRITIASRAR